jgi:hypothetical protein
MTSTCGTPPSRGVIIRKAKTEIPDQSAARQRAAAGLSLSASAQTETFGTSARSPSSRPKP